MPKGYQVVERSWNLCRKVHFLETNICSKIFLKLNSKILFFRVIPKGKPTAKYQGNLVHDDGTLAFECTLTSILFLELPILRLVNYSKAHCASVRGRLSSLKIDGSYHAVTDFDDDVDRNNVPWGACLNSNQKSAYSLFFLYLFSDDFRSTGLKANCHMVYIKSPHMDEDHTHSGYDCEAFLVASR